MYGITNLPNSFSTKSTVDYSLLIVDDDSYFRRGLTTLLNFHNQSRSQKFLVVGEAENSDQALQLTHNKNPDLILLDLSLGDKKKDGITTLIELKKISPKVKVLVLSAHRHDKFIFQAMQAGACGYVVKDTLTSQLLEAIDTIIKGNIYLAPEIATSFFHIFHLDSQKSLQSEQQFTLTVRERDVLQLLVEGKSNQKIANQLFVTVATVKAHLTSIFSKLEVKSRTQAIVKALKLGLV